MTLELHNSLYNKTIDNMSEEDYNIYKSLLHVKKEKRTIKIGAVILFSFPIIVYPLVIFLLGNLQLLPLAAGLGALFSGLVGGTYLAIMKKYSERNEDFCFVRNNFTKEELKQLKKDKVFKRIKTLCKAYEKAEPFAEFSKKQELKAELNELHANEVEIKENLDELIKIRSRQAEIHKKLDGKNLKEQGKQEKQPQSTHPYLQKMVEKKKEETKNPANPLTKENNKTSTKNTQNNNNNL